MRLKIYHSFLILLISLFSTHTFSQKRTCATELPTNFKSVKSQYPIQYQEHLEQINNDLMRNSNSGSCLNYAPIKAHIIRRTNGTGGLSVADLQEAIDTMNARYETACMAFYLCGGVNYIDDDNYYDFNSSDETALTNANNVDNLINIYFANSVGNGTSSYCGYAYYPGGDDVILMDNSCTMNGSTLTHEMGHFFGLPHTHAGGNELVDGSNCATAGDEFCDTPADPQLGSSTVNSSCVYTGTATDANGDAYDPDPTNIMSYSRKACRDFFSNEQYATTSYNFLYVRNYWDCPDLDVDFTADNTQTCDNSLTVNFTESAIGETSYEWDFNNDGVVDATIANPSHTYASEGSYDVRLSITDGTTTIQKVKTAYIEIGANPIPHTHNMDAFTRSYSATGFQDGWTATPNNTENAFRWNTENGPTTSNSTGPGADQSLGNADGIYAYTEASGSSSGDIAELFSPCIKIPLGSANPEVSFWYHMYGSNIGTLHVDLHDGTNWINDITPSITGQQQTSMTDAWIERTFDISAYVGQNIQLRFRAIRGNGWQGDIAIDNVQAFEVLALPVELTKFEGTANEKGEHLLSWQTASEENSNYFELEHSRDGLNFISLKKINSVGESSTFQNYNHTHSYPAAPDNYYRLKMVDNDESFEYSSVIYLPYSKDELNISIFPNPSKGAFQFHRSGVVLQMNRIVKM